MKFILKYRTVWLVLFGTDSSAAVVPIGAIRWYRFIRYSGTDSPILSQYAIGANLYVPATQQNLYEKLVQNRFYDIGALTLCMEDAIEENQVPCAEDNVLSLLNALLPYINANPTNHIPLLFIRVRNIGQFKCFSEKLGKDALSVLSGFSFPKFNSVNGEEFLSVLRELSIRSGEILYAMPIIEDKKVMYKEQRFDELLRIRQILSPYEDLILNLRVGGTDFSSIFGLRRNVYTTIYDIKPVVDCLADIINCFSREECHYVLSGPVWEYFSWDMNSIEMVNLKKELLLDVQNGFQGKTVIHPSQIEVVNKTYIVPFEDYHDACSILNSQGGAFATYNGNGMNETNPHRKWAEKILARAEIFGVANRNTKI